MPWVPFKKGIIISVPSCKTQARAKWDLICALLRQRHLEIKNNIDIKIIIRRKTPDLISDVKKFLWFQQRNRGKLWLEKRAQIMCLAYNHNQPELPVWAYLWAFPIFVTALPLTFFRMKSPVLLPSVLLICTSPRVLSKFHKIAEILTCPQGVPHTRQPWWKIS